MSEWISVEDRLPETEDMFIVYPSTKYFGIFADFWPHSDFKEHKKNTFENQSDDGVVFQNYATHWMPLPEPPKEQDNENHA